MQLATLVSQLFINYLNNSGMPSNRYLIAFKRYVSYVALTYASGFRSIASHLSLNN
jgi:hypothetical protein